MNLHQRISNLRFPDDLPILLGLLTFVIFSAFFLTQVMAEMSLGRPSSTAGIAYFFIPLVGAFWGAVAWGVGFLLLWGLRRLKVPSFQIPSWFSYGLIVIVLIVIGVFNSDAKKETLAKEENRSPKVLIDSSRLVPSEVTPDSSASRAFGPLLFSLLDQTEPSIEWNGRSVTIDGSDEYIRLINHDGMVLASTDLREFDYIGRIQAMPFCGYDNGDKDLAVLVTLRPTSKRSMLLVYQPDGTLIYQNHLERVGPGSNDKSAIFTDSLEGGDFLSVNVGEIKTWACHNDG